MPEAKMKIVFSVIGAVVCFNSVCPVTSYMYDDSAYSKVNTMSFMKYGSVIKKRYTGNDLTSKYDTRIDYNPNNHYHDVNKASAFAYGPAHNWNTENRQYQPINQPLTTPEITPERNRQQEERQRYDNNAKITSVQNQPEIKDRTVIIQETPNRVAYGDNYENGYRDHQERDDFVKRLGPHKERYEMFKVMDVNVNKMPLKADYQNKNIKIAGRNNMPPLSMNSVPNHYRRMAPALKSMQNSEKYADRNSPLMYKMLDDMSRRALDNINKKYDSVKREIKSSPIDNMGKFMHNEGGKAYLKTAEVIPALDTNDEAIDTRATNMPYAVFYRMNPVSMDYHDDIIVDTMDDSADTYKGKSVTADDEIMVSNGGPLQDGNSRMQNKIRSFVNFKKY